MGANFPNSPTNGQTTTVGNTVYSYNSTTGAWEILSSGGIGTMTTKGDLLTRSSTGLARIGAGADGHALVADSAATTGVNYAPLTGFRNVIINGDFSINQRVATSIITSDFVFDRWKSFPNGGTCTYSTQAFTPGNTITGQEPANYLRYVTSGQSLAAHYGIIVQKIEDVRTFAGQTVTLSFWARASTGTPKIALSFDQNFGSGGSPSTQVNSYLGQVTISTSWARYSVTGTVPSILNKVIGTTANTSDLTLNFWFSAGSDYNAKTGSLGIQNNTFEIWGVQLEAGTVATPFERRPQQIELALCQRYYWRNTATTTPTYIGQGQARNGTAYALFGAIPLPTSMRTSPTISASAFDAEPNPGGAVAMSTASIVTLYTSRNNGGFYATRSSGTWAADYGVMLTLTDTNWIAASAEL